MKSLIIGSRGLVGSALKRFIPGAIEGIPVEPQHSNQYYVDITKYETLFKVFSKERPDVVYLAASMAHVDQCETSQGTDVVNVRGAQTVIQLCSNFGSKLIYFSSSYVFDGTNPEPYTVQDEPNPINRYGQQKLFVERSIMDAQLDGIIVRTVGVFGTERLKKNFAKQVISAIFAGHKVFAPVDQFMNPVLSDDLARTTVRLVEKKRSGLFHIAGDRCMSKYDFALSIANNFGLGEMITPKETHEMSQKAARPLNACLDCGGLEQSFDRGLTRFMASEFNG